MVTMILFREKEDDKKEKQREKQNTETTVNIDFAEGTTVADALEQKDELRELGNQFAKKLEYAKNLKQFFIGSFELTIDDIDHKWLKDEIGDRMLIRKEEATAQNFKAICKFMSKHNDIFAEMMDHFGDS